MTVSGYDDATLDRLELADRDRDAHDTEEDEPLPVAVEGPDFDPCVACEGDGCDLCNYSGEHTPLRPAYRLNPTDD